MLAGFTDILLGRLPVNRQVTDRFSFSVFPALRFLPSIIFDVYILFMIIAEQFDNSLDFDLKLSDFSLLGKGYTWTMWVTQIVYALIIIALIIFAVILRAFLIAAALNYSKRQNFLSFTIGRYAWSVRQHADMRDHLNSYYSQCQIHFDVDYNYTITDNFCQDENLMPRRIPGHSFT